MFDFLLELDFGSMFKPINQFLDGLNYFWYIFFRYGNYVLFLCFSIMGIILLWHAREKEYSEKIHGNIELVKKRGRVGSAIFIFIGFGFLFKIFTVLLYDIFTHFPEPQIVVQYMGDAFDSINSLENVYTLTLYEKSIFFLISFISFLSIMLIAIGLYLMFFNKFIIRSKSKFIVFIGIGFFFWILFGFRTSLRLLV